MRKLKYSFITKVDFAHGTFQKRYPHTRSNAEILLMIYFMPFTTRAECPQPRKGKQDSSPAQAPPEQLELCSRCTDTFFPDTDTIPEAAEMQDKTEKALTGRPPWLVLIIAGNSNPYYSHTIPRLPPKELFSASELLTQQLKHTSTQRLWCHSCNSPALLPVQNLHRKIHRATILSVLDSLRQ